MPKGNPAPAKKKSRKSIAVQPTKTPNVRNKMLTPPPPKVPVVKDKKYKAAGSVPADDGRIRGAVSINGGTSGQSTRPLPGDQARYLNLAIINMGEALTTLGNLMQRGATPGKPVAEVKLALLRALAALDGEAFVPPPNEINT